MFDNDTAALVKKEKRAWSDYLATDDDTKEQSWAYSQFLDVRNHILHILDRQDAEWVALLIDRAF